MTARKKPAARPAGRVKPKPTAEELETASAVSRKFSPQMQRFCDEHLALAESNAALAARRAGYSEARARVTASELLKRPDIQEYLKARRDPVVRALVQEHKITLERILLDAAAIAVSDIADVAELKNGAFEIKSFDVMEPSARRTIAAITMTPGMFGTKMSVKLWDKGTAQDRVIKLLEIVPPELTELTHAERAERLAKILEQGRSRLTSAELAEYERAGTVKPTARPQK